MTTNQKIDAFIEKLDQKIHQVDDRLDLHDQKLIDIGALHLELSHKLDTVIRQTADLPAIRDDIAYLRTEVAPMRNNFKKIDEQLIHMEAKDDYLLERINKISNREYA